MKVFKNLHTKYKAKEKIVEISTRKETVLFNLFNDLTVIESVKLYEEVEAVFVSKLNKKIEVINEEKDCIEKFLSFFAQK
jgi:hypothetical protein